MSNVLGFKKKDATYGLVADNRTTSYRYEIDAIKVIPVVSLAWLEKWCKKNSFCFFDDDYTGRTGKEKEYLVIIKDLLKAAKKESGKK